MSTTPTNRDDGAPAEDPYTDPHEEQKLRADLEERWQDESPETARLTDFADEVDGRLGTRHRAGKSQGSGTPKAE